MDRFRTGERTALTGMIVNTLLSIIKLFAGIFSRSTAMIADALHSISDILATFVVVVSFKIAKKPEDPEHPYGHEKAEPIAAKILALFLLAAGASIGFQAIRSIWQGDFQVPGILALYAAAISILVKEALYWYVIVTARKINSTALKAEAWHHRSDALSSVGAFIGIGAARLGFPIADPIAGILVALLILKVAFDIYRKSIHELMDSSAPPATIKAMRQLVLSLEKVKSLDRLKTRVHGSGLYVDAEILVDHFIPVSEGHHIATEVEDLVKSHFKEVKDIMVHINPCDPSMAEFCSKCPHKC